MAAPFVKPMLATLVDLPFDRDDWLFEIKWDGDRAIAEIDRGAVRLYSRRGEPFGERFSAIRDELAAVPHDCILDGEIVVLDAAGRPSLRLRHHDTLSPLPVGNLVYFVFDILELDGQDLRFLPLSYRKESLRLIPFGDHVRMNPYVERTGVAFFREIADRGHEGIIAKNGKSPYREGVRSYDWLKIKAIHRQEAIICGFTRSRGARPVFGALILGTLEDGALRYVGRVGAGFISDLRSLIHDRLRNITVPDCPFAGGPPIKSRITWVRPELVCEVQFRGWTDGHIMRRPAFVALRDDKPAAQVRRETARSIHEVVGK